MPHPTPEQLSDPCPTCGFQGKSLTEADLRTTVRSMPRRWQAVADDPERAAEPHAAAAIAALLSAAGALRGLDRAAMASPDPTADGVAAAADHLGDALEGLDDPLDRPGGRAAVVAAAHAATHHLREAVAAVSDAGQPGA